MVDICLICGDKGFPEALNYCKKCQVYPIHSYCFDVLPKSFDKCVSWFCEDCEGKRTPILKSKSKFRRRWLFRPFFRQMKEKKLKKRKRKDDGNSRTKIEPHVGQETPLLQPSEAHCADKNEGSALERPEEAVPEDAANHSEFTSDTFDCFRQNCLVAQPIVDPVWRGSLKFWSKSIQNVCVLVGHMSSLACSKVYEEAKMLPGLLPVQLLRRCEIWPKGFVKLGPTDQSIALYFFPQDKSSQKVFDILITEMMLKDLAMRAVLENAELLVFTSSMLPMQYWRFQTRYYLWGVFRGKQASDWRNNVVSKAKDLSDSLACTQSRLSPSSNTSSTHSSSLYSTDSPLF